MILDVLTRGRLPLNVDNRKPNIDVATELVKTSVAREGTCAMQCALNQELTARLLNRCLDVNRRLESAIQTYFVRFGRKGVVMNALGQL